MISIGDALLKLGVDPTDLNRGLDEAKVGVQSSSDIMSKSIGGISVATMAVVASVALLVAAFAHAAVSISKEWAKVGSEIYDTSLKLGWTAEATSEMAYAAKLAGATIGDVTIASRSLSRAIVSANESTDGSSKSFDKLGLSVEELMKLSPEEQFFKVAYALAAMENRTELTSMAVDVFGRSAINLLPLLLQGKEAIDAARLAAHDAGQVMTDETAKAADEAGDAFKAMDLSIQGVRLAIGEQLGPALGDLVENHINPAIQAVIEFIRSDEGLAESFKIGRAHV